MKLVSFLHQKREQVAMLIGTKLYPLSSMILAGPVRIQQLLDNWEEVMPQLQVMERKTKKRPAGLRQVPAKNALILSPVPAPGSLRDGYAFQQNVALTRRNRGLLMISQFDEHPVFYFGNHRNVHGPGIIKIMPDHCRQLDFELEVAIVICRHGRNIRAVDADKYIGGYMIMNDLSARQLQMEEKLLNLGSAKGKNFSTVIGPWLVTPDELRQYEIPARKNHKGKSYNLPMMVSVNGMIVSEGNMADMEWNFAEIIERASYGVDLCPGDIIGSGTVEGGSFLELNDNAIFQNKKHIPQWLRPGDKITLEVEGLGTLENTLVLEEDSFSLLNQKNMEQYGYNVGDKY